MSNATPHRRKGHLKSVKAPRGAYTYLRGPVILTGDRAADAPDTSSFAPPPLSACRDYGMPARRKGRATRDARHRAVVC